MSASSGGNNENTVPSQKNVQVARNSSNAAPATVSILRPTRPAAWYLNPQALHHGGQQMLTWYLNTTSGVPKHGGQQDARLGQHHSHGADDAEIKEIAEGQPVCDPKEREYLQKLFASSHKNRRGNIDF